MAVEPHRVEAEPPAIGSHVSVVVHYVATGTFPLSAGRWELLLDDGSSVPLVAQDPAGSQRTLKNGDRYDLHASADLTVTPSDLFVVYVDAGTSETILAIPVE